VLVLLFFIGGLIYSRRRLMDPALEPHIRGADQALEAARANDRGWDRAVMEEAVRAALREQRPEFSPERLHLVLVDDQPGVDEDRAHFVAVGRDGEARVVLARAGEHWGAESVE